jgi:3-oxoadipate enol-lactonase
VATQLINRIAVEIDDNRPTGGASDSIVCIHGLGGSSNTFTPLMADLHRTRVVRIDLPGSARSVPFEGGLSIESFVRSVMLICDRLGLERFWIAGHSMGTIVATHLAVREPARVCGLALFGPLLCPPDVARPAIVARAAKAREGGVIAMADIADSIVATATSAHTRANRPDAVAAVRESLMRQTPEGYAASCEALAGATAADIAQIKVPVLLATGEDDPVAPPQSVRAMHDRMHRSRLVIYPRCGHWTPFECPQECARDLRGLLTQRV